MSIDVRRWTWYRDREIQKYLILIAGLLLLLWLITPVGAYRNNFEDNITGWSGGTIQHYDVSLLPGLHCYEGAWGSYSHYVYGSQFTSAAVSKVGGGAGEVGTDVSVHNVAIPTNGRVRIQYTGSKLYTYLNGTEIDNQTVASAPTWFGLGSGGTGALWDDYCINEGGGLDSIGAMPSTWFLGKDIKNPTVYGLYDDSYALVSTDTFHYTWGDTSAASGVLTYTFPVPSASITITHGAASQIIPYKDAISSTTTISWDKDEYAIGETATINWSMASAYWDSGAFNYKIRIFRDDDLVNYAKEYTITTISGSQTVDTSSLSNGHAYVAELNCFYKSVPNTPYILDYDWATFLTGVKIFGYVYDAWTEVGISGAAVSASQPGTGKSNSTTTDSGAYYEMTGLDSGSLITVSASKATYLPQTVTFTPESAGTFNVTFGLTPGSGGGSPGPGPWQNGTGPGQNPDHSTQNSTSHTNTTTSVYNQTTDGTTVGGYVTLSPYGTAASGATVAISNGSYSASVTTNTAGFYIKKNIPTGGTYTMTASMTGYGSETGSFTIYTDEYNRIDFNLGMSSGLTVTVKDSQTLSAISGASVDLSDGQSGTTGAGGTVNFAGLAYGYYSIDAAAPGYYPTSSGLVVDTPSKSTTIYLTSTTVYNGTSQGGYNLGFSNDSTLNVNMTGGGGAGIAYPPHQVRWILQDVYGDPCPWVNVTATPIESSSPWSWVFAVFGFNQSTVDIQGTTLSGTTGTDGAWTAMMVESVKYQIHFWNTTQSIDLTLEDYPKEEQYTITVLPALGLAPTSTSLANNVNWTFSTTDINTTYISLNLLYNDNLAGTTNFTFWVRDENGTIFSNSTVPGYPKNVSYTFSPPAGENKYYWGFNATHSTFGNYTASDGKLIKGSGGLLVDLELPDTTLYVYISCALIVCLGALFSGPAVRFGMIVVPLFGALLAWIGWLPITGLLVSVTLCLGVLVYLSKTEKKEGV